MAVKRTRMFESDDDNTCLLALQAHQISGTIDPATPIRTLLAAAVEQPRQRSARAPFALKPKDPEIGRMVNERLAPAALN